MSRLSPPVLWRPCSLCALCPPQPGLPSLPCAAERVHAAAPGSAAGAHPHHQCPAPARRRAQRAHCGKCWRGKVCGGTGKEQRKPLPINPTSSVPSSLPEREQQTSEILFSKTHTIYTMQHLRILCINLTTMIRKRIHLFFYHPVASAQKDWKPQQYLLLLFPLTWHFFSTASVQKEESKPPQMFCWKRNMAMNKG